MSGVNKAIVIGNLGKDPEIRTGTSGRKVATFSVATSETWRDKTTGERKEDTTWHRIVVFNEGLIGVVEQYLKKGSKVYLEGAMKTREWTDQGNIRRFVTEVVLQGFNSSLVLLDKREGGVPPPDENSYEGPSVGGRSETGGAASRAAGGAGGGNSRAGDMDDDIPF